MHLDAVTDVDVEGLDAAAVDRLRRVSGQDRGRFDALSPVERRVWLRLKYASVADDGGGHAGALTSDDIRRLGMLPMTPPDEKDAYWRDLHAKLHAPRT